MYINQKISIILIFLFLSQSFMFLYGQSEIYFYGGIIYPEKNRKGVLLERVGICYFLNIDLYYRLANTTSVDISMGVFFPVCELITIMPSGKVEYPASYEYDSLKMLYGNNLVNKNGSLNIDFLNENPESLKRSYKITKSNDEEYILAEGYNYMYIEFMQDEITKRGEYVLVESKVLRENGKFRIPVTYSYYYTIELKKKSSSIIQISLMIVAAPVDYEQCNVWTGSGLEWGRPIPKIGCFSNFSINTIPWAGGNSGSIHDTYYSVIENYTPGLFDEIVISQYRESIGYDSSESYDPDKTWDPPPEKEMTTIPAVLDDHFMTMCMKAVGMDTDKLYVKGKIPLVLYFTPTENLWFRDNPSLKGKKIRLLSKGETLKLLEKEKTETIGGATGTWVKVHTEKDEEGWCFNAYLKKVNQPSFSLCPGVYKCTAENEKYTYIQLYDDSSYKFQGNFCNGLGIILGPCDVFGDTLRCRIDKETLMAFAMDEKQNIAFFTLTSEKVLTYKYKYPFFGCNPHQGSTFKKIKHITYLVDKDTDIKAEPTKNAGSIKQLGKGDILSFIEFGKYYEKDRMLSYSWVKVRAGDGTVGWSNAHFLTELRVEYEE